MFENPGPKSFAGTRTSAGQIRIFGAISFDLTWKYRKASVVVIGLSAPSWFVDTCIENPPPLSITQVRKDRPSCFRLSVHCILFAFCFPRCIAGKIGRAHV